MNRSFWFSSQHDIRFHWLSRCQAQDTRRVQFIYKYHVACHDAFNPGKSINCAISSGRRRDVLKNIVSFRKGSLPPKDDFRFASPQLSISVQFVRFSQKTIPGHTMDAKPYPSFKIAVLIPLS
mmetsp:Transcript_7704/g.12070  ORF Transcript_7704/g.12070 Transcript_7704/m.12070 type:complete len:123 (+) Transcript_7704:329-697(+)